MIGFLVLPARNDVEFARVLMRDAADPLPAASLEVLIDQAVIPVHRGSVLVLLRGDVQALKAVA